MEICVQIRSTMGYNNKEKHTAFIKSEALRLGFMACGISRAEFLSDEAPRLDYYLKNQWNGKMKWLKNHYDKRLDPTKLVPGAKSVVSLLYNYYPDKEITKKQQENSYKLSKYAYGEDYHFVIKRKLKELLYRIREEIGHVEGRVFVDSAPVLDKAWATRSGLGWRGKNALVLTKQKGSFHFIAELIIDLDLQYDSRVKDYCGTCTACINACPTGALEEPYKINGSKCISYFTIELRDEIPEDMRGKFEEWMFGCDICQDVCPWNRFSTPHNEPLFNPHPDLLNLEKSDWEELTKETFGKIFKKSAVKRTKFSGLARNIAFLKERDS